MAGFVINLSEISEAEFAHMIEKGYYSTRSKYSSKSSCTPLEGTLADYLSMKPGDNLFFFKKRKIYGFGTLILIGSESEKDCKYLNYVDSDNFEAKVSIQKVLVDKINDSIYRWICFFSHHNHFYCEGVDMDVALLYKPEAFKALRVMQRVSFIKLDDEENNALKEVLVKENSKIGLKSYNFERDLQHIASNRITQKHRLTTGNILLKYSKGELIRHEMLIEANVIENLSSENSELSKLLGYWDFVSHQVSASPFKPIHYMDKIDIYGYKFVKGLDVNLDVIEGYLVGEIKKDSASIDDVDQVMKYVDWTNTNTCAGDLGMIEAFLIAKDFPDKVKNYARDYAFRQYTLYSRSKDKNFIWRSLRLISYRYDKSSNSIKYTEENYE